MARSRRSSTQARPSRGCRSAIAAAAFDAYVNSTYRSLKAHRLGEVIGAHIDAADAASDLLDALFALRRPRAAWSKYLRWELESEPIAEGAGWRADAFLERLDRLLREPVPDCPAAALPRRRRARAQRGSRPGLRQLGPVAGAPARRRTKSSELGREPLGE